MTQKYEITNETIERGTTTLYRIRALTEFQTAVSHGNKNVVSKYELGGWIESPWNLSQEGNCWVGDNARVFGDAFIGGDALIDRRATVKDQTRVHGNSWISDSVIISGDSEISGNIKISGRTRVSEHAEIYGNVRIDGNSRISGYAKIHSNVECAALLSITNSTIKGATLLDGIMEIADSYIWGQAVVSDTAKDGTMLRLYGVTLGGFARVFSPNDFLTVRPLTVHLQATSDDSVSVGIERIYRVCTGTPNVQETLTFYNVAEPGNIGVSINNPTILGFEICRGEECVIRDPTFYHVLNAVAAKFGLSEILTTIRYEP
jgi:carbonic anhydrase/acetyltransferase-like protein (isoleucine patch superfamily)